MGLIDIFKKKEKRPKEKKQKTQAQQEANDTVANDGRESTYVVEDVFGLRNDMGVVVVGNVHGCIREKDANHNGHGCLCAQRAGTNRAGLSGIAEDERTCTYIFGKYEKKKSKWNG